MMCKSFGISVYVLTEDFEDVQSKWKPYSQIQSPKEIVGSAPNLILEAEE